MSKDWIGNKKSVFVQLGANNHSEIEREKNDFYSTDPNSLEIFLKALKRDGFYLHNKIWECACGMGHLSEVLKKHKYSVYSSDLFDRGYNDATYNKNFLKCEKLSNYDILTNPPYKYALDFVEHALKILDDGFYCIMYLKIQFVESKSRRKLFEENPPKYIYVNSERQQCFINGDMSNKYSSASCYCWFIWEKGYNGETILKWI